MLYIELIKLMLNCYINQDYEIEIINSDIDILNKIIYQNLY